MTVTIIAESNVIGNEKYENVNYDLVTYKETHKRNGTVLETIKIKNGKRSIVLSNGVFDKITVQDETTGRYIYKIR